MADDVAGVAGEGGQLGQRPGEVEAALAAECPLAIRPAAQCADLVHRAVGAGFQVQQQRPVEQRRQQAVAGTGAPDRARRRQDAFPGIGLAVCLLHGGIIGWTDGICVMRGARCLTMPEKPLR